MWVREGNFVRGCGQQVAQIRSDVVICGEGGGKGEKRGQEPVGCHCFFHFLIFSTNTFFLI